MQPLSAVVRAASFKPPGGRSAAPAGSQSIMGVLIILNARAGWQPSAVLAIIHRCCNPLRTVVLQVNASRSFLAIWRSAVPNPSVNRP
jgi:hypothetical protein